MEQLALDFKERLYQKPGDLEFSAVVTDLMTEGEQCWVKLDDSSFYPEGGGQPSDRGQIGPAQVLDVQRKSGAIWHCCDRPLEVGRRYACQVAADRRRSLTQQHTGEHILSGLVNRHWGFNNVGFHLTEVHMTLDFDGALDAGQTDFLELEANRAVWADLPVSVRYYAEAELRDRAYRSKMELAGTVRLVEIPDTDCCACCGTHCSRTGEVGLIKLIDRQPWRGGTRLTAVCGDRALADYQIRYRETRSVGALLSTPAEGLTPAVEKLLQDLEAGRNRATGLIRRLNDLRVKQVPEGAKRVFLLLPEAEEGELKSLAKLLAAEVTGSVFLFAPHKRTAGLLFIFASEQEDVRAHIKALGPLLDLKGGGQAGFAQGVTAALPDRVTKVMTDYCR